MTWSHRPPSDLHLRMQAGERIEAWRPMRLRGHNGEPLFDCGTCPRPQGKRGCRAHECQHSVSEQAESDEIDAQTRHLLSLIGESL